MQTESCQVAIKCIADGQTQLLIYTMLKPSKGIASSCSTGLSWLPTMEANVFQIIYSHVYLSYRVMT